ncbi:MAG TPA: flagellar hook-associated protein FlgK [Anaeromyxobacteraceae bacterium]|nr:flagellar hook-associated protein FlgK [Anaeromyxobacteraceae bacterium]
MNLLGILSSATSSLQAQQTVVAVDGNNVENASTPGYAQQQVNLVEGTPAYIVGTGAIGSGVQVASITQNRNPFVEAQLPSAFSSASSSSAEAQALQGLTALDPSTQGNLASALASFYSSMQALTQDAGSTQLRQTAVASAQALATSFQTTSQSIASARSGLDTQIQGQVTQVNQLAAQVAKLNGQIQAAQASGAQPNSLLDERQAALDQLAQIAGATWVSDQSGNVSVMLGGGLALVTGTLAGSLSTVADASNGGHLAVRISLPGSSSASALAPGAVGGSIGGEIAARDQVLGGAAQRLDQLAYDFANAVNAVHETGYGLDGATGRPLFDVGATASGAASSIAVDAAVANDPSALAAASTAAGVPGDATALQAIVNTEQQGLTGGLTAAGTVADITTQYGTAASQAQAASTQDASVLSQLQQLRASASGVSVDEQLVGLQQAQRTYQAISQVIQATTAMLDALLSSISAAG